MGDSRSARSAREVVAKTLAPNDFASNSANTDTPPAPCTSTVSPR